MAERESRYRRSPRRSPGERRGHRMEDRRRRRRDSSEDVRTRSRRERSRSPQSRRPKDHHGNERRRERQEHMPSGRSPQPSGRSPNHSRGRDVTRRQHTHELERETERGSEKDGQNKDDRGRRRRKEDEREEDTAQHEFGGRQATQEESLKKEEPDFATSGKLTAETNTYKGVVIKYNEPAEARIPKTRWRLYPFKGDQALSTLYIHRQSAFLIGRDRKIVDLPVDHPSCSKQHAVLQYRLVEHQKEDGTLGRKVKPYVIDLESTNGTYVNNQRIEPARYYELKERDMIKFGFSSREYILLHENSKGNLPDDD